MEGLLVIDKPEGPTSHDVVARVRRATGTRRVGHAGTLDPLATGVLVLALGRATRTLEYLAADDKRYHATVRFGISTTTYDREGEPTHTHDGSPPSRDAIARALDAFRGEIQQRPPLFSAIKQGGEPLYRRARRGEAVEVNPRAVEVYELAIRGYDPPQLDLEIHCSKGTYIRSLAHDLGERLSCGAHLAALRRLASGEFTLEQARSLDWLVGASAAEIEAALLPLGSGLGALAPLPVDENAADELRHGRVIPGAGGAGLARALAADGALVAIVEWREGHWKPRKVFHPEA